MISNEPDGRSCICLDPKSFPKSVPFISVENSPALALSAGAMYEGGGSSLFPVVFFDRERETYIGDISVNPTLEYKPFQLMISHKIGVSPNQISIYLADRRKYPRASFSEEHSRMPITGKVNFGLICPQTDCCFLVVLKRMRKSRFRRERIANVTSFDRYSTVAEFPAPPMILQISELLWRNPPNMVKQPGFNPSLDGLCKLRIERDNYHRAISDATLNMHNFNSSQSMVPIRQVGNRPSTPVIIENDEIVKLFCTECKDSEKNNSATSFHPCVNDQSIIPGFKTSWGPIGRQVL